MHLSQNGQFRYGSSTRKSSKYSWNINFKLQTAFRDKWYDHQFLLQMRQYFNKFFIFPHFVCLYCRCSKSQFTYFNLDVSQTDMRWRMRNCLTEVHRTCNLAAPFRQLSQKALCAQSDGLTSPSHTSAKEQKTRCLPSVRETVVRAIIRLPTGQ
jgi:hypothetical protein